MSESIPPPEHKDAKKTSARTPKEISEDRLRTTVGISVLVLATFLAICNVKDGNVCQAMQKTQAEEIDNWAFYQARNIRSEAFEATGDTLSLTLPGETEVGRERREKLIRKYYDYAAYQNTEKKKLQDKAEEAKAKYDALNDTDDRFDLCEAALAVSLAMFGVTALIKRWWMLYCSYVPATIGVFMGIAGFTDITVKTLPLIAPVMKFLS